MTAGTFLQSYGDPDILQASIDRLVSRAMLAKAHHIRQSMLKDEP